MNSDHGKSKALRLSRGEWLALHQNPEVVTASSVPIIMGYNRFCTPLRLWARYRGIEPWPDETLPMMIGTATQEVHAKVYEKATGRPTKTLPQTHVYRHPDATWLYATPDAEAMGDDGPVVVEFKHHSASRADEWDDGIPIDVQAQLVSQMACMVRTRGSASALLNKFGWYHRWADLDVATAKEWIPIMLERCEDFLRMVREGVEPPAEWCDRDVLKRIHPQEQPGLIKHLDAPEWDVTFERFEKLKADISVRERELKEIDATIKQEFGDAEELWTAGQRHYTFKSHTVSPGLCPHCKGLVRPGRIDRVLRKKGGAN